MTETTSTEKKAGTGGAGNARPRAIGSKSEGSRPRDFLQRYGSVLLLILVCVIFSILSPETFATKQNAVTILQQQAVLACLALGLLLPIAVGEFDLSVGYVLGFAAVEAAALGGKTDLPGGVIVPAVILTGILIGTLNGVLTAGFRIHSLIATLGVGFAVSGGTVGISGGTTLFQGVSPIIPKLANTNILGLKSAVWIVFALAIALYLVLEYTPFGRRVYAVGGSERVARLAGVRTEMIKIAAFAIAGGMAACAGILQLGQAGGATPAFGVNLLLPAFAAIFLGATAIKPGVFNVWGTIIAILLLAAGFTGLGLQGVPLWVQPIFDGVVLLAAVLVTRREARSLGG
ncbi:MAG: ABC transporter permease [Actinobacteria bacterium]|nr:ABC transporter permease [Actinomycetota bacterium]